MKHITRWRPDTCSCVLELEWDDEVPEAEREHTAVKVERCGVHQHDGEPHQAVFETVLTENRQKNEVHQHLIQTADESLVEVGERGARRLKYEPCFTFDQDRNLQVAFAEAPAEALDAIRAALETQDVCCTLETN